MKPNVPEAGAKPRSKRGRFAHEGAAKRMPGKVLFRAWAGAAPPKPRRSGAAAVPFGLDFEEGREEALSTAVRDTFAEGFTEEKGRRIQAEVPAGVLPKDGRTAALCTTRSAWDSPDWKSLRTNHGNEKSLDRYHRRHLVSKRLPQQSREERWVRCLRRWEREGSVTDTEFSILPAGWYMDGRPLPVGNPPKPKAPGEIEAAAKALQVAQFQKEEGLNRSAPTRSSTPSTAFSFSARSSGPFSDLGSEDLGYGRDAFGDGLVRPAAYETQASASGRSNSAWTPGKSMEDSDRMVGDAPKEAGEMWGDE
ncbi:unnamed protein product [Effrenium voratum]|nr:unnamed protein product [Effrenium voratum]